MSRRHHHHNIKPYNFGRYSEPSLERELDNRTGLDRTGIQYQDDSLSSINSDEENYLHLHSANRREKLAPELKNDKKVEKQTGDSHYQTDYRNNAEDNTNQRLNRLEAMLEELLKKNLSAPSPAPPTTPPHKPLQEKPSDRRGQYVLEVRRHDFTTSMWINKIQEVSIQNNWDEKTTISFMSTQMSGIVRAWYNTLPHYNYTWPEWKIVITKTFPDNTDFVTTLKRLVTRLKQADESMRTYYFSKMYLIEACKISGEDAVSCLIDGLNNEAIQEEAKAQNFLTPETLYSQYLMTLPEYTVEYAPTTTPARADPTMNPWYYQAVQEVVTEVATGTDDVFDYEQNAPSQTNKALMNPWYYRKEPTATEVAPDGEAEDIFYENQQREEFGHRQPDFRGTADKEVHALKSPPKRSAPVHSRLDKRFMKSNNFRHQNKVPLAAKVCTICSKRGHSARTCRKADTIKKVKNPGDDDDLRFSKICKINGRRFEAFVDTGCTTVAVKEEVVRTLHLKVTKASKCLTVYGGGKVPIVGETEFKLQVDAVEMPVSAVVVPDHVQDVAVIVGQGFLAQKNLCAVLQKGSLNFFEADNVN